MTTSSPGRPRRGECEAYYFTYIDRVPEDEDILQLLRRQHVQTPAFLLGLDAETLERRYAPGKWNVKEVVGHVVDAERVFGYRALCAVRRVPGDIPGMDQDAFAAAARHGERPIGSVVAEYETARAANLAFLTSVGEDEWDRRVRASGFEFTARSIAYILAGHEIHHLAIIRERYLSRASR